MTALNNDVKSVVATEINPIIVEAVMNRYREFAGDIYRDERVKVEVSEGRSFVRRSNERYDVIQLSLTDNVAASSTGIYALSENYLYTKEAFQDYYEHLNNDGILSITRWLLPPPREGVRLVSLSISALENLGVNPQHHIAVVRSWGTITLLLKRGGFNPGDIERLKETCMVMKFDIVYVPGVDPSEVNLYNRFPEPLYYQMINSLLSSGERERIYDNYLFDISPVTDERPFFFHFFKWDKIIPIYESLGRKWQPFIEGGYLVPVVFVLALALTLIFIYLPIYRSKDAKETLGKRIILIYFLCLGFGFMFIEVALIQRFILFLGHPVYAVSSVLFTLLTFSGIGSLFSERLGNGEEGSLLPVISVISVLVVLYLFFLPHVFHVFLGQELIVRSIISSISIIPLSFFMGVPFPLGIRLTERLNPGLIPWAWAVNGCSSVLGSILPMMIALSLGFSIVLVLATVVYLIGLGAIMVYSRKVFTFPRMN